MLAFCKIVSAPLMELGSDLHKGFRTFLTACIALFTTCSLNVIGAELAEQPDANRTGIESLGLELSLIHI